MGKRIKNNSGSTGIWSGQIIEDQAYHEIEPIDYRYWATDARVEEDIISGNLIVATETEDILNITHAIAFIKGVQRVGISLITNSEGSSVNLTNFRVIAVYPWNKDRSHAYSNGVLFLEIRNLGVGEAVEIRIIDTTNAQRLGFVSINTNGFHEMDVDRPTSNSGLELQVRTNNVLSSAVIRGARLEFDSE